MASPFASMAMSMNLPLTSSAFECGKSLAMLGGRPICNAFSKSDLELPGDGVLEFFCDMAKLSLIGLIGYKPFENGLLTK